MADRYPDRPFPSQENYDRDDRGGDPHGAGRADSDPLAELARLIGQNDALGATGKAPHPTRLPAPSHPLQSRANVRPQYDDPADEEELAPPAPPPWMQRARQEAAPPPPPPPQQEYQEYEEPEYQPAPVHPLHRYAAQQAPAQAYHDAPQYADEEPQPDPSRYDDALYGQIESGQDHQRDPAYPDDPYAYQNGYEDEPEPRRRSSGFMTVVAVLALAVVGTGAAFAYRTYVGSPRSGEPPIIKADNSPTKIVQAPSDGATAKTPDRMMPGDGGEKLVSREEAPVDVNSRSGAPRVVFPPLNQNGSPPVASAAPAVPPANGTMPNSEPRKIKTLAVKGDAVENGGIPAGAAGAPAKPAPAARTAAAPSAAAAAPRNPASANASANAPMSLAPQAGQPQAGQAPDPAPPPPTRMAATNPVQTAPAASGGYLVQVSSQKTEADANASYKSLQGKFPAVMGSRPPVIKRADLGDKGVYYRAMVGPFGSSDEATQFCGNLKTAGGQCVVQRN